MHFYFDFISPFGYFAALRVGDLASKHGRACEWHAMLLGVSVLKVMGLKPLLETPLKGPYLSHDAARYARRRRLVLKRPLDGSAMDPVPAARAFHWLKRHHPDRYRGIAGRHARQPIGAKPATSPIPRRSARSPRDAASTAPPSGPRSRATRRASFCARPSMLRSSKGCSARRFIVDREPFWGVDKIEQIDEWLTMGGW